MRPQGTSSVLFALAAAVTAIAQTPSAQDEAMPGLHNASRVALKNVRIIDGTGAPARQNQTLIIESGRIREVGNTDDIAVPEGTRTIDLDGRTVLPGYVMLHEHMTLGSDPNNLGEGRMPGLADHDTIKKVVTFGFSPLETIRMATLDGATFLRIQDRTGSIAVGKEADLQVVRGDPDQDIRDIDNVEIVFANGIAYDPMLLLSRVKGLVGSR